MTPTDALEGRPCWIGVDLSSVEDLTAVVAVFPDDSGDGVRYDVLATFFLRSSAIEPTICAGATPARCGSPRATW